MLEPVFSLKSLLSYLSFPYKDFLYYVLKIFISLDKITLFYRNIPRFFHFGAYEPLWGHMR